MVFQSEILRYVAHRLKFVSPRKRDQETVTEKFEDRGKFGSFYPASVLSIGSSLRLTPWKGKVRTKLSTIGKLEQKLISIDVRLFAKTGNLRRNFLQRLYPRRGAAAGN